MREREAIIDVACGVSRDRSSFGIVYKWTCIQLALSFVRSFVSCLPSLSGDVSVLCFHSDRPERREGGRMTAVRGEEVVLLYNEGSLSLSLSLSGGNKRPNLCSVSIRSR